MGRLSIFVLLILALCLGVGNARAQQEAGWTQMGTLPEGTSALAVDGAPSPTLYALGAAGLSRSEDAGKTWTVCDADARYMRLVLPTATGNGSQATLYSTGWGGPKLSTDGCHTLQAIPAQGIAPSPAHIRLLVGHPANRGIIFAAMDGLGGLYRTINTGANWQAASRGLPPGAWVTTLVVHPRRPERIFAGVRYATADHPQAYVFESDDIGLSWRSVSLGMHVLPNNDGSVTGLAWSKDTLFASTASDGLYSFNEQTKNWTRAALPPHKDATTPVSGKPEQQPIRVASLATDNSGRLYISTQQGVYRSDDKAASWQEFGPSAASSTAALAVDSSTGRALAASGSQGWAYNLAATGIAGTPAAVAQAVPPTPASQVGGIPSVVAQLGITPSTGDEEPTPPALPTATLAPVPPTATVVPATATPPPPQRPTGYLPSDPAEPLDASFSSYVPETKHNIQHGFRDYWLGINGVILLGYPLTEEFEENGATVQYFERGRLEYRDGKVQLGRLGAELTEGRFFQTVRFFVSEETKAYFGPTQHSVTGPFLITWRDLGGLATLGYPLSESFEQGDGHEYQYFERGRLEWHRDLPEGPKIVLGQLGREALERRGWLK